MYGLDILCGISNGTKQNGYPYIERCVLCWEVKI